MIPNQWYVLMESKEVKDKPVGATRMGEKLVFWRDGTDNVSCLHDKCPHRVSGSARARWSMATSNALSMALSTILPVERC